MLAVHRALLLLCLLTLVSCGENRKDSPPNPIEPPPPRPLNSGLSEQILRWSWSRLPVFLNGAAELAALPAAWPSTLNAIRSVLASQRLPHLHFISSEFFPGYFREPYRLLTPFLSTEAVPAAQIHIDIRKLYVGEERRPLAIEEAARALLTAQAFQVGADLPLAGEFATEVAQRFNGRTVHLSRADLKHPEIVAAVVSGLSDDDVSLNDPDRVIALTARLRDSAPCPSGETASEWKTRDFRWGGARVSPLTLDMEVTYLCSGAGPRTAGLTVTVPLRTRDKWRLQPQELSWQYQAR